MTTKNISDLIRPALAHPELLQVTEDKAGAVRIFRVSVHGADYGRICGREGRNIAALNSIVELIDEETRVVLNAALTRDRSEHVFPDPHWNPAPVLEMLRAWHAAAGVGGSVEMSDKPRENSIYDAFFTERLPAEILNPLAKWASVVAQSHGGKVCLQGAHYAAAA